MIHTNGTTTDDVEAGFITKKIKDEFTNFVQNAKSNKFIQRPQCANKVFHLDKWLQLIKLNASRLNYMKEKKRFVGTKHLYLYCIMLDLKKQQKISMIIFTVENVVIVQEIQISKHFMILDKKCFQNEYSARAITYKILTGRFI